MHMHYSMSTHHIRAIICKMFKYTSQTPKYVDTIHSVKTVPQLQQHIHVYTTSNASMYSTVSILTCERQAVIMYDKFRVMHDTPQRCPLSSSTRATGSTLPLVRVWQRATNDVHIPSTFTSRWNSDRTPAYARRRPVYTACRRKRTSTAYLFRQC